MAPKIILPTGTKVPDADLLDGLDSTQLVSNSVDGEQQLSCSELRVQSINSVKRFGIEYNEDEESLDFTFSTS